MSFPVSCHILSGLRVPAACTQRSVAPGPPADIVKAGSTSPPEPGLHSPAQGRMLLPSSCPSTAKLGTTTGHSPARCWAPPWATPQAAGPPCEQERGVPAAGAPAATSRRVASGRSSCLLAAPQGASAATSGRSPAPRTEGRARASSPVSGGPDTGSPLPTGTTPPSALEMTILHVGDHGDHGATSHVPPGTQAPRLGLPESPRGPGSAHTRQRRLKRQEEPHLCQEPPKARAPRPVSRRWRGRACFAGCLLRDRP